MKVLPSAGPERTRLFVLLGLLGVAGAAWWYRGGDLPTTPQVTGPTVASNSAGTPAPAASQRGVIAASQTPEPLKLDVMEVVPDEPGAGRNLFRFGVRPPPPAPKPVYTPPPPQIPQGPPPPPPIPPIPLRLRGLMDDPYGKKRAYLIDASGAVIEAVEGQIVEGRYRLLKIGTNNVVMSYLDGSGQRTITNGGG